MVALDSGCALQLSKRGEIFMSKTVQEAISSILVANEEEYNKNDESFSKQLVLLGSGTLAVLALLTTAELSLIQQILVTIIIALVGVSLAAMLIRYAQNSIMHSNIAKTLRVTKKAVEDMGQVEAHKVLETTVNHMRLEIRPITFWVGLVSYMLAIVVLGALLLLSIWK